MIRQRHRGCFSPEVIFGRSTAFLLAGLFAVLNMGQGDCEPPVPVTCQGLAVTHTFAYDAAQGSSRFATDGDDVVRVTSAPSAFFIFAGAGDDTVCVTAPEGNTVVFGQDGDDSIEGGPGGDVLWGDAGNDIITGGSGDDSMSGGPGRDVLYGLGGNDLLSGDEGSDDLYGGDGDDALYGGGDDDFVLHNDGYGDYNLMDGGAGNDTLYSEHIRGLLFGGSDYDTAHTCGEELLFDIENTGSDRCPVETAPIFSVRLSIDFCDTAGAEKYWPLHITVVGDEVLRFGELFNPPQFAVGSTHVYDFLPGGRVNNIREIQLRNDWDEDFCVSRLRLGINHFTDDSSWPWLYDSGSIQTWVGPSGALTLSAGTIRLDDNWTEANATELTTIAFTGLDYETITRAVEGILLDAGEGPHDTAEWVQVSPGDTSDEANVRLVLHAELPFNLRDWVRVDFVLRVTCDSSTDQLSIAADEFSANVDGFGWWWYESIAINTIRAKAAELEQMVQLPQGTTCNDVAPEFDDEGLWLGYFPRP